MLLGLAWTATLESLGVRGRLGARLRILKRGWQRARNARKREQSYSSSPRDSRTPAALTLRKALLFSRSLCVASTREDQACLRRCITQIIQEQYAAMRTPIAMD